MDFIHIDYAYTKYVFHKYLKPELPRLKAARCVSGFTDAIGILYLSNSVLYCFSISFCFLFARIFGLYNYT